MSNDVLEHVMPFRLLDGATRSWLLPKLNACRYAEGDTLVVQDAEDDTRVFLLASGEVERVDTRAGNNARKGVITAGHYFGERSVLFREPRALAVRALTACEAFAMSGETFLELIERSPTFTQSLRAILREKQKIFNAFDQFLSDLHHAVAHGTISLTTLLPSYRALAPALHPFASDPRTLDFAALQYAVRRLPDNITRTLALFLTDNIPYLYEAADKVFSSVPTDARPRSVFEMMPGKSMVLLRDGFSDLYDFITCLCVFAVEARKIRKRLRDPEIVVSLSQCLRSDEANAVQTRASFLRTLPFTEREANEIEHLWGPSAIDRLHDVALHHEDFLINVRKERDNYNSRHSEVWLGQIANATHDLMGYLPVDLPSDVAVHVISSNTHSVANCLSPFLAAHRKQILEWGVARKDPLCSEHWSNETDLVYALTRGFFRAHPELARARDQSDRASGLMELKQTAFTGIQVELIDTAGFAGCAIDPTVTPWESTAPRALLVNIDFAFGQQAAEILGSLIALFGRNLASVNVLGKAGALLGKRGDILVPTQFIEQTNDVTDELGTQDIQLDRLRASLPTHQVHVGPMLTVAGTLLQNSMMLHYYRHLFRCVGLEMEGAHYARRVRDAARLGVLSQAVQQRYLYYVSDLPLSPHETLSGRMSPAEGIPPLYAVTREILSGVSAQQNKRKRDD